MFRKSSQLFSILCRFGSLPNDYFVKGASDGRREQGAVSGDAQEQRGERGRGPAESGARGGDGQADGGVGPRGCAARGRRSSPELQGSTPLLLRRPAHGYRRSVRRGERAYRWLCGPAGGVQRRGHRVGHALRGRYWRRRDRGSSGDRDLGLRPRGGPDKRRRTEMRKVVAAEFLSLDG